MIISHVRFVFTRPNSYIFHSKTLTRLPTPMARAYRIITIVFISTDYARTVCVLSAVYRANGWNALSQRSHCSRRLYYAYSPLAGASRRVREQSLIRRRTACFPFRERTRHRPEGTMHGYRRVLLRNRIVSIIFTIRLLCGGLCYVKRWPIERARAWRGKKDNFFFLENPPFFHCICNRVVHVV